MKFTSERISDSVRRIHGITGELMYLIEGNNLAALIDTGCGIGSLKSYVETLTKKQYCIIHTHGHIDHALGAEEFNVKTYMNAADIDIYKDHSRMEFREEYVNSFEDINITKEDYIPVYTGEFLQVKEGDLFDLGGITLEIYECPGHTPGSIAILIREERALILGDACNNYTFLFHPTCLGVTSYRRNLLRLKAVLEGKYDKIYLSHGTGNIPVDLIDDVIHVCDDILAGNSDEIPFEFMGDKAYIAKEINSYRRIDGGIGNIIYNKDRIFE